MYFLEKITLHQIPEPKQDFTKVSPKIVLVHRKISPDGGAFLDKMIGGFKWLEEDCIHLIAEPDVPENYSTLWSQPQIKLIWAFEISPRDLGIFIEIKKYDLVLLSTIEIYWSDSLEKIDSNLLLKKQVWSDLKKLQIN